MKTIKLISMNIRHFKGIESFELQTGGESINVYGDNGVGKSTLQDAFAWVLFGKNARMEKQFAVRPLDENGLEIEGVEPEVELVMTVDNVELKLRKLLRAKDTKLWVDDVPQKTQKAYDGKVNEIMDEETFKMLTMPNYFSEMLAWSVQREKLFEICGGISDQEVIAANVELADLTEALNGKSFDDRKAQVNERKKQLKEQIAAIPPRIAEAKRQLPETAINVDSERAESERLLNEIEQLREQKANISSGAAITTARADIKVLDAEITAYKQQFEMSTGQNVNSLKVALQEKQGNLQIAQSQVKQTESEIQSKDYAIQQLKDSYNNISATRQEMIAEYKRIEALIYEAGPVENECPTCKQDLPGEQVEAARKTAEENWKLERSKRLAEIKDKGVPLTAQLEEIKHKGTLLQQERTQLVEKYNRAVEELTPHQQALEKVHQQLTHATESVPNIENDEKYRELVARKQQLEQSLNEARNNANEIITGIEADITALQQQKRDIDLKLAQVVNVDDINNRIKELQKEQRELSSELEQLEYTEHLIKTFETTKVQMLEQHINSKFKYATFKLFNQQKNGEIKETCEVMFKNPDGPADAPNVPYRALNTAAKVNAGLDIINTLQQHYGAMMPIFVDNRESVTKLYEMDNQIISLVVSEKDKQLRVERFGVKVDLQDRLGQQDLFEGVV